MTLDINLQIKGIDSLVDAINNLAASYQKRHEEPVQEPQTQEETVVPVSSDSRKTEETVEEPVRLRQYMSVIDLSRKMGRAERTAGLMARNIQTNFGDMVCKQGRQWLIDKSLGIWLYRNYSGRHRKLNYEAMRNEYEAQLN